MGGWANCFKIVIDGNDFYRRHGGRRENGNLYVVAERTLGKIVSVEYEARRLSSSDRLLDFITWANDIIPSEYREVKSIKLE